MRWPWYTCLYKNKTKEISIKQSKIDQIIKIFWSYYYSSRFFGKTNFFISKCARMLDYSLLKMLRRIKKMVYWELIKINFCHKYQNNFCVLYFQKTVYLWIFKFIVIPRIIRWAGWKWILFILKVIWDKSLPNYTR